MRHKRRPSRPACRPAATTRRRCARTPTRRPRDAVVRSDRRLIPRSPDDRRVPIRRDRHRGALPGRPFDVRTEELAPLLRPDVTAAREDPRGADLGAVLGPTDDRGVAVSRDRDGPALLRSPDGTGSHKLGSLLRPHPALRVKIHAAPVAPVVGGSADDGRVPVARDRHGSAHPGGARDARADQAPLLDELRRRCMRQEHHPEDRPCIPWHGLLPWFFAIPNSGSRHYRSSRLHRQSAF